jgi:uncharacterized membrane protein (DUF373 family)
MNGQESRRRASAFLEVTEQVIYGLLALLLAATALVAIASAAKTLVGALSGDMSLEVSQALNALILVLLAVEILNTVRISMRAHALLLEPFLVVGVIASVRRILMITLDAAALTKDGRWSNPAAEPVFKATMLELGLLGVLVLVLVLAIVLLRRHAPTPKSEREVTPG